MNPHNFSIYACGLCGTLMVVGSIWLLRTGVINLSSATKDGTLSVDIVNKVKISTTYPALGLFFIGLFFIGLGVWFSRGDVIMPLNRPLAIVGKIEGVDDASLVTVTVVPDQYRSAFSCSTDTNGQLNRLLPDLKEFTVRIAANGYRPQEVTKTLNIDDAIDEPRRRRLDIKDVRFSKINSGPVTVTSPPVPGRIEPTPAGTKLEPLRAAGTDASASGGDAAAPATHPSNQP